MYTCCVVSVTFNETCSKKGCVCHCAMCLVWSMQWFLHHHGGEDPNNLPGTPRDKPFCDNLLEPEAPLATMFLQWAGQNFPGWPTKTEKLVSNSVATTCYAFASSLACTLTLGEACWTCCWTCRAALLLMVCMQRYNHCMTSKSL